MKADLTYKKRSPGKRLFFIAGVFVLVFIICILAVESWGRWFYRNEVRHAQSILSARFESPESLNVLCIGDSHTFGLEASKGQSYPDHLQQLLNEGFPEKVQVINYGLPGRDTHVILKAAKQAIGDMKVLPHIVVVQGGINDGTSWHYMKRYLAEERVDAPFWFRLSTHLLFTRIFYLELKPALRIFDDPRFGGYVARTTENEYVDFADYCHAKGALVVFLSYATLDSGSDHIKQTVADRLSIPYVRFPQPATHERLEIENKVAPFMHPNDEGYFEIAGKVSAKIVGMLHQSWKSENPDQKDSAK